MRFHQFPEDFPKIHHYLELILLNRNGSIQNSNTAPGSRCLKLKLEVSNLLGTPTQNHPIQLKFWRKSPLTYHCVVKPPTLIKGQSVSFNFHSWEVFWGKAEHAMEGGGWKSMTSARTAIKFQKTSLSTPFFLFKNVINAFSISYPWLKCML